MNALRRPFLRSVFALALQAILIVQLLAAPLGAAPHGDWTEVCTAEGMIKVQIGADGSPPDQAPVAHDHCDLCLPALTGAPPIAPDLVAGPTDYHIVVLSAAIDALVLPLPSGPPIGPRGPPSRS